MVFSMLNCSQMIIAWDTKYRNLNKKFLKPWMKNIKLKWYSFSTYLDSRPQCIINLKTEKLYNTASALTQFFLKCCRTKHPLELPSPWFPTSQNKINVILTKLQLLASATETNTSFISLSKKLCEIIKYDGCYCEMNGGIEMWNEN